MKATGNQFPTCANCVAIAPSANAPGQWPYLGYITGSTAPGACGVGQGWNCGNPWTGPTNTAGVIYPVCNAQQGTHLSSTQASGQPTGLMPTSCGVLTVDFLRRFWCSGTPPCGQAAGWPSATAWCAIQRCGTGTFTRAVRRVLK